VEEIVYDLLPLVKSVLPEYVYFNSLGYTPQVGQAYSSPFTNDSTPSFKFHYVGGVLKFKCFSTGMSGDCIDLIMLKNGVSFRTALEYIYNNVFPYTPSNAIVQKSCSSKPKVSIDVTLYRITHKSFVDYWTKRGVTLDVIKQLHINPAAYVKIGGGVFAVYRDNDIIITYCINGKYQVYRPNLSKKHHDRWRSNLSIDDVFGIDSIHLPFKHNKIYITSSAKDVAVIRSAGFCSIAATTESKIISDFAVAEVKKKSSEVCLLYNNDEAGRKWGKANSEHHGIPALYLPLNSGCKDPDEFAVKFSINHLEYILK